MDNNPRRKTYLDLEDNLLALASSIEDLDVLYQITEQEDINQIQNTLLGMRELFRSKISTAYETLEEILAGEREAMMDKVEPVLANHHEELVDLYAESLIDPRN